MLVSSLDSLAAVALLAGDPEAARGASEEFLSVAPPGAVREGLLRLAHISVAEGDLAQARSHLEGYLESIRVFPWWAYEEPTGQLRLGRVALLEGERETASPSSARP